MSGLDEAKTNSQKNQATVCLTNTLLLTLLGTNTAANAASTTAADW